MFDAVDSPRRRHALAAAVTAILTAAATLAVGGMVVVPPVPPLVPAAGLAVPLALLTGPAAVIGVGLGVVLAAAGEGTLSWWTLLDAGSYALLAAVGWRLWGCLPTVATGEAPRLRSREQGQELAAVGAVAAATAAPTLAWGTLVGWGGSFHAIAVAEFGIILASMVALGLPVLVLATVRTEASLYEVPDRTPLAADSGGFRGAVLTPVLWLGLGSLLTLLLTLAQLVGADSFAARGLGSLAVLFDPALVGIGGRRVAIVLGAAALAVLAATYAPTARTGRAETDADAATAADA